MARGRTTGTYTSDGHTGEPAAYNVEVPNNLYAIADFGWTAATVGADTMPKNFGPRHVLGVDATGHRVRALCPDPTAALWIGTVTVWDFIDNAGGAQVATVTGYVAESWTRR